MNGPMDVLAMINNVPFGFEGILVDEFVITVRRNDIRVSTRRDCQN